MRLTSFTATRTMTHKLTGTLTSSRMMVNSPRTLNCASSHNPANSAAMTNVIVAQPVNPAVAA